MGLKVKLDRQDNPRRYFFDVDVQLLCFSLVFFFFYER